MLGEERRSKILERVTPLLQQIDPEVHLREVLLDSTRQQLAFILQKGEWPVIIGLSWVDYVSHRDEDLKTRLAEGLARRLNSALRRAEQEEA